MGEEILDLDTVRMNTPIRLGGKKFIPFISFDTMLLIMEKSSEIPEDERKSPAKMMRLFKEVVQKILKDSSDKVTDEMLEKMDAKQYMVCLTELVMPILSDLNTEQSNAVSKKKQNSI